jgi:hypothetical protein
MAQVEQFLDLDSVSRAALVAALREAGGATGLISPRYTRRRRSVARGETVDSNDVFGSDEISDSGSDVDSDADSDADSDGTPARRNPSSLYQASPEYVERDADLDTEEDER